MSVEVPSKVTILGFRGVAALVLVVALSACGRVRSDDLAAQGDEEGSARTVAIYSSVVRQLITEDHTFGGGKAPFERVFIIDGVVQGAGNPMSAEDESRSRFPPEVREGITAALSDLPPVEFVSDRDDVIVEKRQCGTVKEEGALVSLGPIDGGGDRVQVANELYFSCRGGQWLTYVVERSDDEWSVTGTTGPVAIS